MKIVKKESNTRMITDDCAILSFFENLNTFSVSSKIRIKKECALLCKTYDNLFLSCVSSIKIELTIIENTSKYTFILNNFFPFRPPQIYYNGEPYLEFLRLKCDFQKKLVKTYKKKDCLCCDSYSCDGNWAPSIKLLDVIQEIKSIVDFKRSMVNVLLADKIKRKYLIADIDINSFLI